MSEPVARKRSRAAAKAAGRQLENDLVTCLTGAGLRARRVRQKGAKDEGDVEVTDLPSHVLECKNARTLSLSGWWKETEAETRNAGATYGWMVFKRHGKGDPDLQWAATTTGTLAALFAEILSLKTDVAYLRRRLEDKG